MFSIYPGEGEQHEFICAAHTDEDVATALQVFEEALVEAKAG